MPRYQDIPRLPTTSLGAQYKPLIKKPPPPPKQIVAEVGEDFTKLAERLNIETADLVKANIDDTSIKAGAVYNVPQFGGLTETEQFWQESLDVPASYVDFLTHQETLDVTGVNKFGGRTSPGFETEFGDLQIPEGMNFEEFKMFAENTKDTGFWDQYGRTAEGTLDLSAKGALNLPTMGITDQEIDPRYQSYQAQELSDMGFGYYPDEMIEIGGMPSYMKWEQNPVSGEWQPRPPEAVFDALYEMNGIDPNDPAAVEWFWSLASEDMLYAGEFFDVIEWPSGGGYGGYGGMPTPSRQYGRGQQQARGDYASYLSLTSWSI